MLAPRRLNPPVQVLGRQTTPLINLNTNEKRNGERREGLVGADGQFERQLEETMKWINNTATITSQEQQRPTHTITSSTQAPDAPPTTYTIGVQTPTPAAAKPEGGARVEIESLPGQNKGKPSMDDANLQAPALPGVNQDTSNMGEVPKLVTPATAPKAPQLSGAPAITVNKPLPGQNQEAPVMGDVAIAPAPTVLAPASSLTLSILPSLTPFVANQASTPLPSATSPLASVQDSSTAIPTSASGASDQISAVLPSSSLTSFVTMPRSGQSVAEASVTSLGTLSTTSLPIGSTSVSAAGIATTQAIAAAQSATGVLALTSGMAASTSFPTVIPSDQGSILHPTARTLLILFVVLGVLSILIGIVILLMIRSHRRRSQQDARVSKDQSPYDASNGHTGVTTHISADPNDNPFLTASEKAIIDRAAPRDSTIGNSRGVSDAISAFIQKSRRLTYKISP
ncbi:hypothetical protein OPT61_g9493 [Boeremia exigua]|uniref:Uncharacterized protein n=1 Tax=Boeremia exigua TaxID=749465 RepID=A0ACC2HVF6_9PLEO|nr:hypothetical protein OPT61_g9493 [Boeremia exigua]